MEGADPKKLIVGFLLLAVVVSSSAFLLILNSPASQPAPTVPNKDEVGTTGQTNSVPANAFIENVPTTPTNLADIATTTSSTVPKENLTLTDELVVALGKRLDEANANGISTANGNIQLVRPDPEQIAEDVLTTGNWDTIQIPDWEKEINTQHISVLTKYTSDDIETYNKEVAALMEEYLTPGPGASPLDSSNGLASIPFQKARTIGEKIVVPEPLAGFHWSLMKMLAYQQKAIDLTKLSDTDPVRAALIAQAQEPNYLNAIVLLTDQLQRRTVIQGLSQNGRAPSWLAVLYSRYLGVPTAHAQWIVVDVPGIAREIWEYVKMIITEKLKDLLVHKLVMQTIQWIQGGGKPQFVTNWEGFLTGAAKDAAGHMIDTIAPGLCTSFAPLNPDRSLDALPSCTIDKVVANVQNFARSFETGGWIAYGAAMQPSNNLIGSIIQVKMLSDQATQKKGQATQNDTESGSSYLSSQVCVRYGDKTVDSEGFYVRGPCLEWKNTTPGEQLANAVKDSGAAPLLEIVNADDFAALINALINAALSKLVKLGTGSVSKGLLGLNMAKQSTASSTCEGLTGTDLSNCQAGWQPVTCTQHPINVPVTTNVSVTGGGQTYTGTGTGNVSLPNGADCTGGTDLSEPSPGGSGGGGSVDKCKVEHCGAGWWCRQQDGLNPGQFCSYGLVQTAVGEAKAASGPAGGCNSAGLKNDASCGWLWCVCDQGAFKSFLLAHIAGSVDRGDEIGVATTCDNPVCTPSDGCPANAGQCLPTGAREERFKCVTSFLAIQGPGQNCQPTAIGPP